MMMLGTVQQAINYGFGFWMQLEEPGQCMPCERRADKEAFCIPLRCRMSRGKWCKRVRHLHPYHTTTVLSLLWHWSCHGPARERRSSLIKVQTAANLLVSIDRPKTALKSSDTCTCHGETLRTLSSENLKVGNVTRNL